MTCNNSIHTATKMNRFELFYGRTSTFENNLTFNTENGYLLKLQGFRNTLYEIVRDKLVKDMNNRIE